MQTGKFKRTRVVTRTSTAEAFTSGKIGAGIVVVVLVIVAVVGAGLFFNQPTARSVDVPLVNPSRLSHLQTSGVIAPVEVESAVVMDEVVEEVPLRVGVGVLPKSEGPSFGNIVLPQEDLALQAIQQEQQTLLSELGDLIHFSTDWANPNLAWEDLNRLLKTQQLWSAGDAPSLERLKTVVLRLTKIDPNYQLVEGVTVLQVAERVVFIEFEAAACVELVSLNLGLGEYQDAAVVTNALQAVAPQTAQMLRVDLVRRVLEQNEGLENLQLAIKVAEQTLEQNPQDEQMAFLLSAVQTQFAQTQARQAHWEKLEEQLDEAVVAFSSGEVAKALQAAKEVELIAQNEANPQAQQAAEVIVKAASAASNAPEIDSSTNAQQQAQTESQTQAQTQTESSVRTRVRVSEEVQRARQNNWRVLLAPLVIVIPVPFSDMPDSWPNSGHPAYSMYLHMLNLRVDVSSLTQLPILIQREAVRIKHALGELGTIEETLAVAKWQVIQVHAVPQTGFDYGIEFPSVQLPMVQVENAFDRTTLWFPDYFGGLEMGDFFQVFGNKVDLIRR